MSNVSFSRYSKFLECQERYRLEYIVGVEEKPSTWLPAGTAMHSACDLIDLEGAAAPMAAEAFRRDFDALLAELETQSDLPRSEFAVTGVTKDRPAGRDQTWWNENVDWMLSNYQLWRSTSGYEVAVIDGRPAVELDFQLDLGNGTIIRGFIDRVAVRPDGTLEVIDLKTGQHQPGLYQLATYAYALRVQYGLDVPYGSFWMLAKDGARGGKSSPKYLVPHTRENSVQQTYRRLDESIKAGLFVPNIGEPCSRCPVLQYCQFS